MDYWTYATRKVSMNETAVRNPNATRFCPFLPFSHRLTAYNVNSRTTGWQTPTSYRGCAFRPESRTPSQVGFPAMTAGNP